LLALFIVLLAQSPPQGTATIRLQTAIFSTEEGHRTEARLRAEWEPKVAALAKRDSDIAIERQNLGKESRIRHGIWPFHHRMSAKRKAVLQHAIDVKATAVKRERADDSADLEKDQTRAVNNIAGKMRPLIDRYSKEKGYTVVFEAGSPESNVISGANDITSEIVTLYDQTYRAAP
jgi:Skp family chaperone for outer membrane proteins